MQKTDTEPIIYTCVCMYVCMYVCTPLYSTLVATVNCRPIVTGPIMSRVSQYFVFASFKKDFIKFDHYDQPLYVRDSESRIASICVHNPLFSCSSFLFFVLARGLKRKRFGLE